MTPDHEPKKPASKKPPGKPKTTRASPADDNEGEAAVLAKLAEMAILDRALGERLHAIVKDVAPSLTPRLWYGMPAYARGGKVVCFFQAASKFKTRYATLGFMHEAQLDEGAMWPTAFALLEINEPEEKQIRLLIQKALGE